MVKNGFYCLLVIMSLAVLQGCNAAYTQSIPVSTNPIGATLYADGQVVGETPQAVELDRSKDHILTLTKEGYKQVDVSVKRHYQTDKVLRNAVQQGVSSGNFFNDATMGIERGLSSMEQQEDSGEAYVLMPQTVSVTLVPVGSHAAPVMNNTVNSPVPQQGGVVQSLFNFFKQQDYSTLSNALERTPSGQVVRWTNSVTGVSYTVTPRAANMVDNTPIRAFDITAEGASGTMSGSYKAMRNGPSMWEVMTNAPAQNYGNVTHGVTEQQPSTQMGTEGLGRGLLEAGAAAAPTVGKSWGSSHSSSHESFGSDGSYNKSTTKTSTSVGVSVNPLGAVKALEDLVDSNSNTGAAQ